jgi:recombination protein RecT
MSTESLQPSKPDAKALTQSKRTTEDLLKSEEFKERILNALPKHLSPDRMISVALTAMTTTPGLKKCTQESFFRSMLKLSQVGLEPDGRLVHLIPYGDQVQLIIDFKGLVELAMRSGKVANIHADVVRENDEFEWDTGSVKKHVIDFRKARGEMYASYCVVTFKDGTKKAECMSKEEIDAVRSRSRAGTTGPWKTDYCEMAKKTVFRRLSKWIPLSPEERGIIYADDDVPKDITGAIKSKSPLDALQFSDEEKTDSVKTETTPVDDDPLPFTA